jgi:glycerophosphoryl diester phosphodiesterase
MKKMAVAEALMKVCSSSRRNFMRALCASAAGAITTPFSNSYVRAFIPGYQASERGFNHPFFARSNHPDAIAHRGGDGERPGETMLAMQHAFDLNADVLEMDVYLTKDGHLVLMHDLLVSKTTEMDGPIRRFYPVHEFTLEELQHLNAGYHWPRGGQKDDNFSGIRFSELKDDYKNRLRVPALREVIGTFPKKRMNIEMKPALTSPVDALATLIRECELTENVLVASFWHPYLKKLRSQVPKVATSASAEELIKYILEGKRPNADAIQVTPQITAELKKRKIIRWSIITQEFVERCHRDNLPVHAWTINQTHEMTRLTDLGTDGIITDYPTCLLETLGRPVPEGARCSQTTSPSG